MKNRALMGCLRWFVLGCGVFALSGCAQPTPIVITVIPPPMITVVVTSTEAPSPTETLPLPTRVPPTVARLPSTAIASPPTATRVPPTATRVPPTATRVPPTTTRLPPTLTRIPTRTPTRLPPTLTRVPAPTATRILTRLVPVTHATGPLSIRQTYLADLDEGKIISDTAADIWFQAVTATQRYVTPVNGARIAKVGMTSVDRNGCAAAPLSDARININDLPVGSYVCVRTNGGRYSQFRVNAAVGPSPGTLVIGYTTWQ